MCKNKILRLQILIIVIPLVGLCAAYFTVAKIAAAASLGLSMIGGFIGIGACIASLVGFVVTVVTLANLTPDPNDTMRESLARDSDSPQDSSSGNL